jgi:hypothetical protein
MPGSVGIISGIQDRELGRTLSSAASRQRFGRSGALMAGGGNIFVGCSQAGIGNGADTTEDTLFSVSIPAGAFDIVGRQIMIESYGSITAQNATKDARIYFGTTSLTSAFHVAAATTSGAWSLVALITKTGANQQTGWVSLDYSIGAATRVSVVISPNEVDTAPIVVKVTGQTSAGGAGVVLCNMLTVSGYN